MDLIKIKKETVAAVIFDPLMKIGDSNGTRLESSIWLMFPVVISDDNFHQQTSLKSSKFNSSFTMLTFVEGFQKQTYYRERDDLVGIYQLSIIVLWQPAIL